MSNLIQCPSCAKKYNLKGKLPAVFHCTGCQQPMDLTGFPGYEPEPPPKAPPSAPARSAGRARGGGSRRRRDEDDDERGERGRRGQAPPKKSNATLVWVSVGAVVVAGLVTLLVMSKSDPKPPVPESGTTAASGGSTAGLASPTSSGTEPAAPGSPEASPPDAAGSPSGSGEPASPGGTSKPPPAAASPGSPAGTKPAEPAGSGRKPDPNPPKRGSGNLLTWAYADDVTAAERQAIDKAVDTVLHEVGFALREAQEVLLKHGLKSVWRLISEFKVVHETQTFETKAGKQSAMILDRELRRIDGYLERVRRIMDQVSPESSPDHVMTVARAWNAWLETGGYKTPRAPWDPRVDMSDEPTEKPVPGGR